jgi:uncharacterized protein (TIGR02118 family)
VSAAARADGVVKTVGFMPRKPGTARADFRAYYESRHAPLAVPLFPFHRYRRNHLVDQAVEPGFDCLSEFWVSSLNRIGELMGGAVGETMRTDERNFLDQPRILAVYAAEALLPEDEGDTLLLLTRDGGSDEALVAACRAVGAGLDLLAPLDDRGTPFDAMASLGAADPVLPPGWRAGPRLAVDRCETDPATLMGAQAAV